MRHFTTEKCREIVPNIFNLVLFTGQRARDLCAGIKPKIKVDGNKELVTALQEIEGGLLDIADLRRLIVRRHNINVVELGYSPEFDGVEDKEKMQMESFSNEIADDMFFGGDDIETQD